MHTISVAEARAIDRDAVERLGMPSILLMENAAHAVAAAARQLGERSVILCGPGNNGGDGLAVARLLGPNSARVYLFAEPDPQRAPDAALQLRMLRAAGWILEPGTAPRGAALEDRVSPPVWIDALFGTGLVRAIEGRAAEWVESFNRAQGPKLAIDVPSGLDADSGRPLGSAVCRADVTVTFLAAKHGLVLDAARSFVGRLDVAELGIPASPG